MNNETARYIMIYFSNLLTDNEKTARRHSQSLEKFDMDAPENASRSGFYFRNGLLSDNPAVLRLLEEGYEAFEQRVYKRIMAECPEKVFFNNCPQCGRLARTPYARQCRFCGYDWHNRIAAKFQLESTFSVTGRGFYLSGQITEGEVTIGCFVDLTMLGLAYQPQIQSIEYGIKNAADPAGGFIGLGIDALNKEEMDFLRKTGSFGMPLDILKQR